MKLAILAVLLCTWSAGTRVASAQSGAAAPQRVAVSVAVGCLVEEGPNWVLRSASEPLKPPASRSAEEGGLAATWPITVDAARLLPAGTARYRLIGFLKELNLASHKGQRVLVRGPLISDGKEKRINLMSVTMVAPACSL